MYILYNTLYLIYVINYQHLQNSIERDKGFWKVLVKTAPRYLIVGTLLPVPVGLPN